MVLVWDSYKTDAGRVYPFTPVSLRQINEVSTNINPLDLLPNAVLPLLNETKNSCGVPGLTYRLIRIYAIDGAEFEVNYYQPFNQSLFDWLTATVNVAAFELIGERIKYGRLKRMLDNV